MDNYVERFLRHSVVVDTKSTALNRSILHQLMNTFANKTAVAYAGFCNEDSTFTSPVTQVNSAFGPSGVDESTTGLHAWLGLRCLPVG